MKRDFAAILAFSLFSSSSAAQVLNLSSKCDVVARVNGEAIGQVTLAERMRERHVGLLRTRLESKSNADIETEAARERAEVLQEIIDDVLLAQRARELGLPEEVHDVLPEPDLLKPEERDEALRRAGFDPQEARADSRRKMTAQKAIVEEVLEPLARQVTEPERREHYRTHPAEFQIPEEVTLAEVLVAAPDYDMRSARVRAEKVLGELRAGADFRAVVAAQTPGTRASFANNGELGTFQPDELREAIHLAIQKLSPGEYTEPIETTEGYQIIRLSARKELALRPFDEPDVQRDLTRRIAFSHLDQARKVYVERLRNAARIEICDDATK